MKFKTLIILACFQLLIAVLLGIKIYRQTKTLGTQIKVAPIEKESVTFNPDSELEFFYEPQANSNAIVNTWVPYEAIYTINSDSLNERFDYTPEKPDKTFRIVTLGDSYTYGLCVNTENNYTEQLEDLFNDTLSCEEYNKFEVINLGVLGYDIQYSSERYKLRGQMYNPDLIIWLTEEDDIFQINEIMLPVEKIIAEKLRNTGEFDKLVEKGEFYPSWTRAMQKVVDEYGKSALLEFQIRFLEEFRNNYSTPLLIVTFPSTSKYYREILKQFAVFQSNVFFHDKIPEILEIDNAAFPNDGHPTVLGHELIAKNLFEYLTKENIIKCSEFK